MPYSMSSSLLGSLLHSFQKVRVSAVNRIVECPSLCETTFNCSSARSNSIELTAKHQVIWNFLASQASSSLVFSQPRELPHKTSVASNEG